MKHIRDIVIAVVALAALLGCGRESWVAAARRTTIDSITAKLDTAALARMADSLAAAGDATGELLVRQNLGKAYRDESFYDNAIAQHNRALELASKLCDTVEIVRALNNLGTNFRRLGILDEATEFHYQALSYSNQYSDKVSTVARKNRVVSLNGIGNIYMTVGNTQMADSVLRAALAGEKELGSDLGQAINWANLGAIMRERGMLDSAWFYYKRSMDFNRKAGSDLGMSLCHKHMGELCEQAGNLDSALAEYSSAYAILDTCNDTWHWLEATQAMARVLIGKGDLDKAAHYIAISDSAALSIHSLEHQAQTFNLKYLMARRQGRVNDALEFYIKYDRMKDSVLSSKNMEQIQNTRIGFERGRSKSELDKITGDYHSEHMQKNLFLMLVALVVVLAAVSIYLLRVRNHNQLLANQLLVEQLLAKKDVHRPGETMAEGDRAFLERFTQAIKQSIDTHQVDMERIASHLCMTTSQLRRRVRTITGINPMEYVNNVRMVKASHLLTAHPEMTVGDVAEQCGFDDVAYFSRLFKKTYQLTPTEFRRG